MKKYFSLLLFNVISLMALGQNGYYDALILSRHLTSAGTLDRSVDSIFLVLDRYVEPTIKNDPQDIIDALNMGSGGDPNPFLEIVAGGQSAIPASVKKLPSLGGIGNLDVTKFADGLAQFLIERSKQELSVAFFDGFKKDLKKYPELKVLFPTTASFIENIEAYNYASFLQTLREAFAADLASIPAGLRNLRTLTTADCLGGNADCVNRIQKIEDFFKKSDGSVLFVASTIIIDSLKAGASLPDVLNAIANDEQVSKFPESNISNSLLLADVFSQNLQSRDNDRVWITREELKRLRDSTVLKIYFGLIYQQCKNLDIKFKKAEETPVPFTSILAPASVGSYFNYLNEVINAGAEVNRIAKEIISKKKNGEKFTLDDYVNTLNASANAVKFLMNWKLFNVETPQMELEKIINITRAAISIYYNIQSSNYSSAISNAFIVVDQTLNDTYEHREKILRYGSFIASVVQAESSEDVQKAIEAVALPAGSASIKKNSALNISLNAYLGGFWGNEYLADTRQWKETAGVSAPIGVGVSHRVFKTSFLKGSSLTYFVSVIDLGAVVSYRLHDDSTENLPELKFQNIFAPGLGIIFGFPKVPISLGYMNQVGPALREIVDGSAVVNDNLNHRWYFFLAVDIPLINFYTKPIKR